MADFLNSSEKITSSSYKPHASRVTDETSAVFLQCSDSEKYSLRMTHNVWYDPPLYHPTFYTTPNSKQYMNLRNCISLDWGMLPRITQRDINAPPIHSHFVLAVPPPSVWLSAAICKPSSPSVSKATFITLPFQHIYKTSESMTWQTLVSVEL